MRAAGHDIILSCLDFGDSIAIIGNVVIAVISKSDAVLRCIGRSLHPISQNPVRFPCLVSRLPDISTVIVLQLSKGRQCCIIHDKGCIFTVRTFQAIHQIQHVI